MTGPATAASDDELLFELLERARGLSGDGSTRALDDACAAHPRLAEELRSLWATALFADSLAEEASSWRRPAPSSPHADRRLEAGDTFGEYELLGELGRGGMGVVYRARQQNPDRIVALKMILRPDVATSTDLARFRAEAAAAAKLNDPSIVRVYEVGEHDGKPYFSMQLIEGSTLARLLSEGPLPSRTCAELLLPITRAMAEAHRHGVLHRDLKPSNILLDESGRPFLTDFGLAKRLPTSSGDSLNALASITQSGAILGTPSYMAPEQAAGQRGEVSAASDVYSLGAILYAMLTGRPPFQAAAPIDTLLMVLDQDPLPPRMVNSKVDADLEMIALKCLQKPADLRYASAADLADDLQAYLRNEPVAAQSSHFSQIITRAFRETHHAAVLENWGLLWMGHSLVVFCLCLATNWMKWQGVDTRWPYILLWSVGVGVWAPIFWELRRRSGPITFVERQIAHIWAGSTIASTLLYFAEWAMHLKVLALSPVLPLIAGNVFLAKAGVLSGTFYLQAGALYATAFAMAVLQNYPQYDFGLTLMGVVIALGFFLPGLKYYRQRKASEAAGRPTT